MNDGFAKGIPKLLLQAEGAAILGATLYSYSRLATPLWPWYKALGIFFIPDLGMLGYLASTTVGSVTYNAMHTETPGIVLACAGWARGRSELVAFGLLWLGHIGLDRMIGAGLKYGTAFAHTHLGVGGAGAVVEALNER